MTSQTNQSTNICSYPIICLNCVLSHDGEQTQSTNNQLGIIEPTFVGIFMKGHQADHNNWRRIWMGASAISFLGGFVFLFFADASIQSFDSIEYDEKGQKIKTSVSMKTNKSKHEKKGLDRDKSIMMPTYRKSDIDSVPVVMISTAPDARDANDEDSVNDTLENTVISSSVTDTDSKHE